ncbi:hypothetical protein AX16_007717 [Volvariella volvacea WC 439]|nr:hypothetical protein AX16_007717 [Volvariella volvacea WC 439]
MILDEKSMLSPPPPYIPAPGPPPFRNGHRPLMTFTALPAHLLLEIVYATFPQTPDVDRGKVERQRKTLFWLSTSFRLVNHACYIASMHVLRSTYLPSYNAQIRPPYTSDPFPSSSTESDPQLPITTTLQRETTILDLFIALKVREDVWADDTELHLEREEGYKDLFDLNQPRTRLEDLVRMYGMREGVITLSSASTSTPVPSSSALASSANLALSPSLRRNNQSTTSLQPPSPPATSTSTPPRSWFSSLSFNKSSARSNGSSKSTTPPLPAAATSSSSSSSRRSKPQIKPIPFSLLSVSFSTRKVGLVMTSARSGQKKTIVEVSRSKDEKLEVSAKKIAKELKVVLRESAGG